MPRLMTAPGKVNVVYGEENGRLSGKQPAFPFYVGDWKKDGNLQMCSLATRGAWIELLGAMHENRRSGVVSGTLNQLSRLCGCSEDEMVSALVELSETEAASIEIGTPEGRLGDAKGTLGGREGDAKVTLISALRHEKVTVKSRRMVREAQERENAALRKKKSRERKDRHKERHRKVTKKSRSLSSSSSSSSDLSPTEIPPYSPPNGADASSPARRVFECWNGFDALTKHRALTDKIRQSVNARLKEGRSEADLCQAVARYAELCHQKRAPGYNGWSLSDLLSRNSGEWVDRMLDENYEGLTGKLTLADKNKRAGMEWLAAHEKRDREKEERERRERGET